jgi:ketol-acid reductoisomerase
MHTILDEIRDGTFAKRWIKENETSRPNFSSMRTREHDHTIEQVGSKLRKMMPFLDPVEDPAE